jgi:hypothetical protein
LARIAKDGHVLRYTANIGDLIKTNGKLSIKRIGIKDASAFYGFCAKHDRELFSCIENERFVGRPDQCLAVAYRTLSRELYGKDAGAQLREILRGADKGRKPFEQVMLQRFLDDIDTGNQAARREQKLTLEALVKALGDDRPEVLKSVVFDFSLPLPFMFAGAWSPFTDVHGNEIQKGDLDQLLEQIFVSSFAGDEGTMICISWRDVDDALGKRIAEQLIALPDDRLASATLQFVLKHIENIFFNPDWHMSLSEHDRKWLEALAADGIDALGSPPSSPVRLDLQFDLPILSRSFFV